MSEPVPARPEGSLADPPSLGLDGLPAAELAAVLLDAIRAHTADIASGLTGDVAGRLTRSARSASSVSTRSAAWSCSGG